MRKKKTEEKAIVDNEFWGDRGLRTEFDLGKVQQRILQKED